MTSVFGTIVSRTWSKKSTSGGCQEIVWATDYRSRHRFSSFVWKRGSEDPNRAHEGQLGSVRKPSSLDRDLGSSVSDRIIPTGFFRKSESPICLHIFFLNIVTRPKLLKWNDQNSNQSIKICHIKMITIQQANKCSTLRRKGSNPQPVANAINVLQACIYKSVKTGPFLKSLIAPRNVKSNMLLPV